jgi:hypothetical protein
LPYVIRRIFGYGRMDWSLRDIGSDRVHLCSIIQEFLSPWQGELWKALLRLQDHTPAFTFQYAVNDLPSHLRSKLATLCVPDIVRGRTTTTGQHFTSLALDPLEYFLFHLLSYVVSDQQSLVGNENVNHRHEIRLFCLLSGSSHAYGLGIPNDSGNVSMPFPAK